MSGDCSAGASCCLDSCILATHTLDTYLKCLFWECDGVWGLCCRRHLPPRQLLLLAQALARPPRTLPEATAAAQRAPALANSSSSSRSMLVPRAPTLANSSSRNMLAPQAPRVRLRCAALSLHTTSACQIC